MRNTIDQIGWVEPVTPEADGKAVRAFAAIVSPHLAELLKAARQEIRRNIDIGDFHAIGLTPEAIVADVLVRAWQERQHRPPELQIREWLFDLLSQTAEDLGRRTDPSQN